MRDRQTLGADMVEEPVAAGVTLAPAGAVYVTAAARVVKQYERGVVLRLGKLRSEVRGPGFTVILRGIDKLRKVNMTAATRRQRLRAYADGLTHPQRTGIDQRLRPPRRPAGVPEGDRGRARPLIP